MELKCRQNVFRTIFCVSNTSLTAGSYVVDQTPILRVQLLDGNEPLRDYSGSELLMLNANLLGIRSNIGPGKFVYSLDYRAERTQVDEIAQVGFIPMHKLGDPRLVITWENDGVGSTVTGTLQVLHNFFTSFQVYKDGAVSRKDLESI